MKTIGYVGLQYGQQIGLNNPIVHYIKFGNAWVMQYIKFGNALCITILTQVTMLELKIVRHGGLNDTMGEVVIYLRIK